MEARIWGLMVAVSLFAVQSAGAQVVSGVLTVTGAEMH